MTTDQILKQATQLANTLKTAKTIPTIKAANIWNSQGVYEIINRNGHPVYVGQGSNVSKRLRRHLGLTNKNGTSITSQQAKKIPISKRSTPHRNMAKQGKKW